MFGMQLFLVVGGSAGAIALALWLLARQTKYGTCAGSQPGHARVEVPPAAPASTDSFAEISTAIPPLMSNEVPAAGSDDAFCVHAETTSAAKPVAPDAVVGDMSFPSNQDNTPGVARSDVFDTAASWATTDVPAIQIVAPSDHGPGVGGASGRAILDSLGDSEAEAGDTALPFGDGSSRGTEDAANSTAAYHLKTSSISAVAFEPAPPADSDKMGANAVQGLVREEANLQVLPNQLGESVAARSDSDEKTEEPFGASDPSPNAQHLATEAEIAPAAKPWATDTTGVLVSGGELLPPKVRADARADALRLVLDAPAVDVNDVDVEVKATADRPSVNAGLSSELEHLFVDDEAVHTGQISATRDVATGASQLEVPIPDARGNAVIKAIERPPEVRPLVASDVDGEARETAAEPGGGSGSRKNPPQRIAEDESAPAGEIEAANTIGVSSTEREVPPAKLVEDVHGEGAQLAIYGPVVDAANAETDIQEVSDELYWDADPLPDPPQPPNEKRMDELPAPEKSHSRQPYVARHRDRRGQRRSSPAKIASTPETIIPVQAAQSRPPAEFKLRLILHPVRRTAGIAAVLTRPVGYPEIITLSHEAGADVRAFGEDRYDDVDLEWTPGLLSGELRLDCEQGYQWLRSSRRIHMFRAVADEPNLISVGFAALKSPCAIICRLEDSDAVRSATRMCGSSELTSHDRWAGIPHGWAIFSNYVPTHEAMQNLEPDLTALDPGVGAEIRLTGVLQISAAAFAAGSPPHIEITPFPAGARVTIDGVAAEMGEDGAWRADGWDTPGQHLVDVVPGPSATYRILADPWVSDGWETWDAHPGRFTSGGDAPWAQVKICGANVSGPSGEHLVAAEPMATLMALGQQRGVASLRARPDAPIAVGLLREVPAFLISASGPRRTQGRISWLAPPTTASYARSIDPQWVSAVRSVALRRLTLEGESVAGQGAWRRARDRARRYVKEDK
jgi:hypothetical protein